MPEPRYEPSSVDAISVRLPIEFTQLHRQAITQYLRGQELSSGDLWVSLIQSMDLLRQAVVIQKGQVETFSAIYDRLIDRVYSDRHITDLLALTDPENESEPLRATVSRRIGIDLRTSGLWPADVPESQFLVAFCLYWWQMFVRGYAFEIAIYHDLAASGIVYTAHDLRERQTRLSHYDLSMMGFQGDVKTSTYFVQSSRNETLAHDFYITRMYHSEERKWHRVVWLKPAFWHILNGTPTFVDYDAIWQVLPGVAQILLRKRQFVVVLYDLWKQRVIARQQGKKTNG